MIKDNSIRIGDKVRVVSIRGLMDCNYAHTKKFLYEVGTVIEIDKGWEFPYMIKFDDEEVEELNTRLGTLLWKAEQLEFWSDKEDEKLSIANNDLDFLYYTLESNINALIKDRRDIERQINDVVYSLQILQSRIGQVIRRNEDVERTY